MAETTDVLANVLHLPTERGSTHPEDRHPAAGSSESNVLACMFSPCSPTLSLLSLRPERRISGSSSQRSDRILQLPASRGSASPT